MKLEELNKIIKELNFQDEQFGIRLVCIRNSFDVLSVHSYNEVTISAIAKKTSFVYSRCYDIEDWESTYCITFP